MKNIANSIIGNSFWNFLSQLISRAIQFLVMIVVARILRPDDFGVFGVALIFINFMILIQDMGLGEALIQRKEDVIHAASVIFFNALCLGLIWFFALFIGSKFIAHYFHNDTLEPILKILGVYFLVAPFYTTQISLLRKALNFKKLFFLSVSAAFIAGVFTICLAFSIKNIWVLVFGFLVEPLVMIIMVWKFVSWRPILQYDIRVARATLRFGCLVSLSSLMLWALSNMDIFFITKFLGFDKAGIYSLSFRIATIPYFSIAYPIALVMYSVFCRLHEDMDRIKEYYLLYLYWMPYVAAMVGLLIVVVSHSFVYVVLGSKWHEAVSIIRLLSLSAVFGSLAGVNSQVFRSLNRPDIDVRFCLAKLCVFVPVFYLASQSDLATFSWMYLIVGGIFTGINMIICVKLLKLSYGDLINVVKPTAIVASFTVAAIFLFRFFMAGFLMSRQITALFVLPCLVVFLYCAATWLFDRKRFKTAKMVLKPASVRVKS